jgi:GntR family transcriptional regulator, transcriptional repressor for pyruvate dehydrogenase complex
LKDVQRKQGKKTLVLTVSEALREQIEGGKYAPGDRLPSETGLTEEFSVSRTVIREAVANLRADKLLESRQGAGVYVLTPPKTLSLPFQEIDPARVSSMIEVLELRTAVETESAALAAVRRSPSQEETIVKAHQKVRALSESGESTSDADFELHLAIAEATNNPRFREFLNLIGPNIIPRRALDAVAPGSELSAYLSVINQEHEDIVNAILSGEEAAARDAMRNHLRASQTRYRALLRQTNTKQGNV